jgi:uncharacterized membrane protein
MLTATIGLDPTKLAVLEPPETNYYRDFVAPQETVPKTFPSSERDTTPPEPTTVKTTPADTSAQDAAAEAAAAQATAEAAATQAAAEAAAAQAAAEAAAKKAMVPVPFYRKTSFWIIAGGGIAAASIAAVLLRR